MKTIALFTKNLIQNGFFIFLAKVLVWNVPLAIIFQLLRSNEQVQKTVSESFPVYHIGKLIMISSQLLLSAIGFHSTLVFNKTIYHYSVFSLQIDGGLQTFIGFSCLGLGVMWVFTTLIISWTGKTLAKTVYIFSGLIIIFILNVSRMAYLTWFGRNGSNFSVEKISLFGIRKYDHHDLFNFFIYIIIFLLFILWVEVFAKKHTK